MKKDLLYAVSCITFIIVIGGGTYEHMNVVPVWSAAPPLSLSMFQGQYGLRPDLFWKIIHPVNLVLFSLLLIVHWRSERRKYVLTTFAGYFLILVITAIYLVPELLSITHTAYSTTPDADLTRRASLWETLSLVRLGVLLVLATVLLLGLTKGRRNPVGS